MVFLDYEPYTNRTEWNKLTDSFNKGNARPLIDQCLKKIMWRTSKVNVLTEMDIPQQQEIVHNVKMNELEARFYFSQHSKHESEFHQAVYEVTKFSNKLKMNARTLKLVSFFRAKTHTHSYYTCLNRSLNFQIMEPLRKLRRDCTVPTIAQKIQGLFVRKIIKTRAELHEHMVQSKEFECKRELEIIASSCNGNFNQFFFLF